jgi:hypothetical protein
MSALGSLDKLSTGLDMVGLGRAVRPADGRASRIRVLLKMMFSVR